MRRHRALAMIATCLILFTSQARGQQPVHRVGVLGSAETPEGMQSWLEGLRERGYVVGQNLQIEYRYSQARNEQIPALVAELVAFGPEVIVTGGPQNTVAVHTAAPTIPLIFIAVADPVALGLVESLAHPGGNVTGFATLVPEDFSGNISSCLRNSFRGHHGSPCCSNPTNRMHQLARANLPELERLLGVTLVIVEASKPDQFKTAFERAQAQGAQAISVADDALIFAHSAKVVGLAARYRLPAMFLGRRYVQDGGLMSYAPNPVDCRLRGQNPQGRKTRRSAGPEPTRFYLTVNLKTAAALGITVPPLILAQADEVIE
jgi:putative ABC transport system substrate-binding protein